jgi:hypothetical protein
MPKSRVNLFAGFAAIAFLGMAAVWWANRVNPKWQQQLPDGTTVRLQHVTYDREFRLRLGRRWQDYLGMALPEKWAGALGAQFIRIGTSNTLTVCLTLDRNNSPAQEFRAATVDSHGCEFGLDPVNIYSAGEPCAVYGATTFPRGDEDFRLRLYDRQPDQTWSAVADFPVKNPKRHKRQAWNAEALPITKTVGGVPFTLVALKTGILARHMPAQSPKAGEWEGAALTWMLPSSQKWSLDWELADFKGFTDAFGQNVGRGGYSSSLLNNGEYLVCVDGGLCVEEPVWKVEAEFIRKRNFPTNELWVIRGIAIPSGDQATSINLTTNINGTIIQLMGVSGANCPTPELRQSLSGRPIVHLVSEVPVGAKLNLARAVDGTGREASDGWSSSDGPEHVFGLKIPKDAKTVDLTFVLTKRVPVTYYVKPSRITPAELKALR